MSTLVIAVFVYADTGAVLGIWNPGGYSAKSTLEYLKQSRLFYVRSCRTGKLVWSVSVLEDGMPIAVFDRTVWTDRIVNLDGYFLHGNVPQLCIDIRSAYDGSLKMEVRIPYSIELKYSPNIASTPLKSMFTDLWDLVPY